MELSKNARKAFLVFELTVPRAGSYNGKWSQADKRHILVRDVPITRYRYKYSDFDNKTWTYNFGDGWVASIKCTVCDRYVASEYRKISGDFCGYEWMVDSILNYDNIVCM